MPADIIHKSEATPVEFSKNMTGKLKRRKEKERKNCSYISIRIKSDEYDFCTSHFKTVGLSSAQLMFYYHIYQLYSFTLPGSY